MKINKKILSLIPFMLSSVLLSGCAQPFISHIKVTYDNTCIVDNVRAPQWVCKSVNKIHNNKYYVTGEYQPPKIGKYETIKKLKIRKHYYIRIKEFKKQSIYGNLILPVSLNKKAIKNAKIKLIKFGINPNNYIPQIINKWISPNGNIYELIKFYK